jgi:hypothetical protein
MRIVSRKELMGMDAGILFAPIEDKWIIGGLSIYGGSFGNDFTERNLGWVDCDNSEEAIDRLEDMDNDSSISYSVEQDYGREGLFDDSIKYLVYEPSDIKSIFDELTK